MEAVIMPKLGLTMEEGTIVRWLRKEGDPVEKGEILFEVETDKATIEVEATASGTLGKILLGEGETATILQVIAYLIGPNEQAPDEWILPEEMIPMKEHDQEIISPPKNMVTPIAEKIARERGINLDRIQGTGRGGKVTKEDVLRYTAQIQSGAPELQERILASPRARRLAKEKGILLDEIQGSGPQGRITEQDILDFITTGKIIIPSRIQRITAKRMIESFSSAPHFYLKVEVDASKLVEWREMLIPVIERRLACRLTYTDLLLCLVGRTLKNHACLNAMWDDGHIRTFTDINIGLAVAVEEGLVVPILKNVEEKTLSEITQKRNELAEKATEGKLTLEELEGGTFTLTNLGMFGIDEFAAIINPPQSAILAIGRIVERVIAEAGQMVIKPIIYLTLSIDHRVLDGAVAAAFLAELKDLIEEPEEVFSSEMTYGNNESR
jgi:pyruvate dehydrogenase E2 component (dihydrolipoamide acetyltransferase)